VGTGTLYRHFPTREALAVAVYHEEVVAMCARARELQATLPPDEALAAFLRGFVSHLDAHRGLAQTLTTLLAGRSDAMTEGGQALGQAVADLLDAAVEAGTVRNDVGVGAVMMAVQGICAAYDHPGCQTDADGVVTLVLDGLRRKTPVI
jgi:AcrR family transcriptional regulator